MKKLIFLVLPLMLIAGSAFAQRTLRLNDITSDLNVFSGKDSEAGIVVSCPGNMELTFESTHDKVVDVFNKELKGEEMYYYLRFNTGKKYRGRELTIRTDGFNPIVIKADLEPKELKMYQVIDPDAAFIFGCYYEYRKRGSEFFRNGMYIEAKEQYNIAITCSDCPEDSNIKDQMASIDSITLYMQKGDNAADLLDYNTAINYYSNILALNPSDVNARNIRNHYLNSYRVEYKQYYDMAERYKAEGEYEKALLLYEKVMNAEYVYAEIAAEEVNHMRSIIESRKQHARVFLLEYSMQTPIGISYGTYKNRKAGRYFNFSLHQDVFKLVHNDYEKCQNAEFSITPFGWDFNLVPKYPHFWLFFGFGYTGVVKYENEDGSLYDPYTYIDGVTPEPKLAIYSAVSPEVGLLVKVWRVALRYTYQYRFPLGQRYKDRITQHRHSIGLGFTF